MQNANYGSIARGLGDWEEVGEVLDSMKGPMLIQSTTIHRQCVA